MKTTPLEDKLYTMFAPVVADLGFSLVCVRTTGESGVSVLQVMAEDPETRKLGVDDCAKISRSISAIMDVEDPINGAYRLEVSSPGIDRLLLTRKDFEDYTGFEAKIETMTPNENGQKRFRGKIINISGESVKVQTDTDEVHIPYAEISKAKLVLTDELIKATANLRR